jgi:hypothetical protein
MKINAKTQSREGGKGILSLSCRILAALICFYVLSVGSVPVIVRYTCDDGKLNWLPSIPGAMATLEIYERPARLMSSLPFVGAPFELSANLWFGITDPPDTTP